MANETVKFREVQERVNGVTVRTWTEYSVREVIISVLGISLSTWGPWLKWDEMERVDQNGAPL